MRKSFLFAVLVLCLSLFVGCMGSTHKPVSDESRQTVTDDERVELDDATPSKETEPIQEPNPSEEVGETPTNTPTSTTTSTQKTDPLMEWLVFETYPADEEYPNWIKITGVKDGFQEEVLSIPAEVDIFNADSGKFITYEVLSIFDEAFAYCDSIKKVILSDKLIVIGKNAFRECINLETVVMGDNVVQLSESAFSHCASLKTITLSKKMRYIDDNAFFYCTALQKVEIPSDCELVEIGSGAFSQCTNLESIVLPEGLSRIESYAFMDCSSLGSIVIPASVEEIYTDAFNRANLQYISVAEGSEKFTSRSPDGLECYAVMNKAGTELWFGSANSIIPEGIKVVSYEAFAGRKHLQSINIPSSVTKMSERLFDGCEELETITVAEGNPTFFSIDESGEECNAVLYFDEWGKKRLKFGCSGTRIPSDTFAIDDYAFVNRNGLKEIVIPESVERIGVLAFNACKNLTKVTMEAPYIGIGLRAFLGCSALSEVIIKGRTDFEPYVFEGCTALSQFTAEQITTIAKGTFKGCTGLTEFVMPEDLSIIEESAFEGCIGLTGLTFPERFRRIDKKAFSGCTGLTEIYLPESLSIIESLAFDGCTGLTKVIAKEGSFADKWAKEKGYTVIEDENK